MPRKHPSGDDLRTQKAREELIQGPSAVDLDVHDFSVRVAGLPLFRRTEEGNLCQALRPVVLAGSVAGDVTFTVSDGDSTLDTARARIDRSGTLVHLFVPEVYEPRTFGLSVEGGGKEPFEAGVEVRPQRKWSVFLVHHSHLDIGYTDTQGAVLQHHLQYLDSVLDLASATDDWPEDAKFRWNVEATWPLLHWIKNRPESDKIRFFDRVREGCIEICALPFSMHTEAYSIDELARQLRFADDLRGRYDVPIQTDVPGTTIGLLSSLVDADIRYLSVAHNYAGRSAPHLVGGQGLTRLFYWRAPNGKRLLVWYTDSPHGSAYMEGNLVGLAEDYQATLEALPGYLAALAESPYPYRGNGETNFGWTGPDPSSRVTKVPYPHDVLHLRVQGIFSDNASPSIVPAEIVREWNEKWAYPQLRLATNCEFFTESEARLAESIQTYSGDWTDWWVDGIGSGERVPCVAEDQENAEFRVRGSRLTFIARDVPACGYRRYDLIEGEGEHEGPAPGDESCIENEYYLVRFDLRRGRVTELLDRSSGVRDPSLHYEITGGIDSPDAPHVPGSADHMRAIRHSVGLENEKIRVAWATMEAPLVQFGNIHLPFPETIDPVIANPATVYSWALNNIWDTNFPSQQQGETEFGYAVASGEDMETPELGMRTAAALTMPLLGILSAPSAENDLPERGSFFSVEHPLVDVVALAPSKRGHDLKVMLQSLSSAYEEVCVSLGLLRVTRAWVGTHLEKHLEEARVDGENVRFVVPAGSLVSLVVDLERGR